MCLGDDLQELVQFLVYGAGTVMCLRWCSIGDVCAASLYTPHLVDGLMLLAAVVLPTQPLHAVTELLELLVTELGLIHSVAVLCTAMSTVNLYPVIFMNRCYTWLYRLNDEMAIELSYSESKISNT
jgi:hypothetical protein